MKLFETGEPVTIRSVSGIRFSQDHMRAGSVIRLICAQEGAWERLEEVASTDKHRWVTPPAGWLS